MYYPKTIRKTKGTTIIDRENLEKQKEYLSSRYKFIYQNSPLILAYILSLNILPSLASIIKRCGITINEDDKNLIKLDSKTDVNIFEALEEYLIGDGNYADYLLFNLCEKIKSKDIFLDVKKEFDLKNGNIGIGKYDQCMKTVLDIVYSFISRQDEAKTNLCSLTFFGAIKEEGKISERLRLYKLEALNRYYDIWAYRNSKDNSFKFGVDDKGIKIIFSVDRSVVCGSSFIDAFRSYHSIGSFWTNNYYLELEEKRKIYFKFHDELPWNFESYCIGKKCHSKFSLKEEDIIYHRDNFICICPNCGGINGVNLSDLPNSEKISERIRNRFKDDDKLDRKLALISELYFVGGIDIVKQKVKK